MSLVAEWYKGLMEAEARGDFGGGDRLGMMVMGDFVVTKRDREVRRHRRS